MDTSDGDDYQLLGDGSHQLLRTEVANDYSANTAHFRRLIQINDVRKSSHSASDHSYMKSLAELEFCPAPKLWREIEEGEYGQDRYEPKAHPSGSSVSPQFGENGNKLKWQGLKQSCIENGEQWKKFKQDIKGTLRIADAYLDDKKRALCATTDTEKSLREECDKIVKENDRLIGIQSDNVAIHRKVTQRLDNDLQSIIVNGN